MDIYQVLANRNGVYVCQFVYYMYCVECISVLICVVYISFYFQQNEGDNGVKVLEIADPSKQVHCCTDMTHLTCNMLYCSSHWYLKQLLTPWKGSRHGQLKKSYRKQQVCLSVSACLSCGLF